jgi:hypothetical protein
MMPSRRRAAHLLLALALLLTQQMLAAHPLAHRAGAGGAPDHPSTPVERAACMLCVAGAASSSALPSVSQPVLVVPARLLEQAPLVSEYRPPVTLAFSARAPPILL